MHVQSVQAQQRRTSLVAEPVIPSVRGEFYNYSCEFSIGRPLCYLFKCKANKSRPLEEAERIDHEIDLVFLFGNGVRVCSPNAAPSVDLLGDVVSHDLKETLIARCGITEDDFYRLRQQKDGDAIAKVCRAVVARAEGILEVSPGNILTVTTESGKYCLMLVKEVSESSIKIDASHILL
jgi:hypothetical protein